MAAGGIRMLITDGFDSTNGFDPGAHGMGGETQMSAAETAIAR